MPTTDSITTVEVWKPIPNLYFEYLASSRGRIVRLLKSSFRLLERVEFSQVFKELFPEIFETPEIWREFELPHLRTSKHATGKGTGYYMLSSHARIAAFLGQRLDPKGYFRTQVVAAKGKYKGYMVHRLIALAFLGAPRPDQVDVNHLDGNKKNNSIVNLEWASRTENLNHAYATGLHKPLTSEQSGKLTKEEVLQIRSLKGKFSGLQLAEMFNIGRSAIYCILNDQTWQDI